MEYCISICSSNITDIILLLGYALRFAKYVEIRLDKIKYPEYLLIILQRCYLKHKIIITYRNKENGGFYDGREKDRLKTLKYAISLGLPFIDLEYDINTKGLDWFLKNRKKTKIILSYHNFEKTPGNVDRIFDTLRSKKPDVIKICTYANSFQDNLKIFSLFERKLKSENFVAHAMGEKGEISRIIGALRGNYFTYASMSEISQTAPGQISIEKYKSFYFLDKKNKKTKIFGLVGNPVKHSFGYIIHNYAFKNLNLNSVYINFPVDNLLEFINSYKDYFEGLSVTIPFKEKIIPFLDYIEPEIEKSGAVNTVVKRNNKLYGYNTDTIGIYKVLKKHGKLKDQNIIILGAGGSARAILAVISNKSNKIFILNRNIEKAEKLASEFNCNFGKLTDIPRIKCSLLINTTPVGMYPKVDESPVEKKYIKNCTVFDLIYNPYETKLLKFAVENNCETISGFDMFLYQAEEQFYLFTEKRFLFNKYKNYFLNKISNVNKTS